MLVKHEEVGVSSLLTCLKIMSCGFDVDIPSPYSLVASASQGPRDETGVMVSGSPSRGRGGNPPPLSRVRPKKTADTTC